MTRITFEEDELIVIAMFEEETRQETIKGIEEILPYIKGDTELEEIVIGTVEKMKRMPDSEFARLDLEAYKQEPEDE
ncbi:MAG: transposon-transfer assisting family protein [Lachnospiraceae bacterium]|nr:transposon-transfer assisting family protein [Lachnospiraceae bacterium]